MRGACRSGIRFLELEKRKENVVLTAAKEKRKDDGTIIFFVFMSGPGRRPTSCCALTRGVSGERGGNGT